MKTVKSVRMSRTESLKTLKQEITGRKRRINGEKLEMCDIDTNIKELENSLQLTGLSGIRCGRVKAEIKQPRWRSDKTPTQQLYFIISAPFKPNQHHHRFDFSTCERKICPH